MLDSTKEICLNIQDDFDLDKIIQSGQCFRAKRMGDHRYRFISGDSVLYISGQEAGRYSASCIEDEWNTVWEPYFDLKRNYKAIVEQERNKHPFVDEAMDFGRGLRILRQDAWETLITFIISQRKSIPAISKCVEAMACNFGRSIKTSCEEIHLFPTPQQLEHVSAESLAQCGLGYRTSYVMDAVGRIVTGKLDLDAISLKDSPDLVADLQSIQGVGTKVANCVALFSYGRTECAPIDVWISRAIEQECGGEPPFPLYGNNAGIIQQYIFYYMKHRR